MPLTNREKIAHLHRRLGFGATLAELDAGERLGPEAVAARLIAWETAPALFDVHPFECFWRHREKEEADPGAYRLRIWWTLAMLTTGRPLQEKLALFWHGHFAVSDGKVEHGPMMLDYLQTLRRHAAGPFPTLLKAVAKNPAMMRYLDLDRAIRGHPNENFAREVMELFTLGIGHYTERDVQELSRCLTGWASLDFWWESGRTNDERLAVGLKERRPAAAFALLPAMRDDAPKTLLGVTKDLDGDAALDLLAARPETAAFLCRKLWRFFAGTEPDPAALAALTKTYAATGGSIRSVLKTLVAGPAFWSAECVGQSVKSPADYAVGIARQQGVGPALLALREKGATPRTQLAKRPFEVAGDLAYHMEKQGLSLLYPPDVSGWKGGRDWIGPAAMAERMKYRGELLWADGGPAPGSLATLAQVKAADPKDPDAIAARLLAVFDAPPDLVAGASVERRAVAKIVADRGGLKALENPTLFTDALYHTLRLLSASPRMHLC